MRFLKTIAIVSAVFLLMGCATHQLEKIAKDWCLSIRASQIIPVYPLTEDFQPGDILLIGISLDDQIKEYESKGFLPINNTFDRIYPKGYFDFYGNGYGIDKKTAMLPRVWQNYSSGYSKAPYAAFPSYSFSVSSKEGLNVALPVQGVPVGLNFLGASNANGSITISKAHTYGIDMVSLIKQINVWQEQNKDILKKYAPVYEADDDKHQNPKNLHWLRVVNRVYLVSSVNVNLIASSDTAADVTAGVKRPVDLISFGNYSGMNNGFNTLNRINKNLQVFSSGEADNPMAFGGRLKLAMASDRSVTLNESFPRPLVIGYVAFDFPVLEGGELGDPISSYNLLNRTAKEPDYVENFCQDSNTERIDEWVILGSNKDVLMHYLESNGYTKRDLPFVRYGCKHGNIRDKIIRDLISKENNK